MSFFNFVLFNSTNLSLHICTLMNFSAQKNFIVTNYEKIDNFLENGVLYFIFVP